MRDAHTTDAADLGNGRVIAAEDFVDDLNLAMTWLAYPGRKPSTAKAAELDFA